MYSIYTFMHILYMHILFINMYTNIYKLALLPKEQDNKMWVQVMHRKFVTGTRMEGTEQIQGQYSVVINGQ